MKQFAGLVESLSRVLDRIAAFCTAAMMSVVVVNIVLRATLGKPLLGTIDYVNILMALTIGLGLPYCGLKNGHIAVEFIVDKLSHKSQAVVSIIINLTALLFWGAAAWYMALYAQSMMQNNLMAGTISLPLYPVVYLIALGLLVLCLVLVLKLSEAVRMIIR